MNYEEVYAADDDNEAVCNLRRKNNQEYEEKV